MQEIISNWKEFSNGNLFDDGGVLIKHLYPSNLVENAPALLNFYQVFEVVKDEDNIKYGFKGVYITHNGENAADIANELYKRSNKNCTNIETYGNKPVTEKNNDFRITDRQLNNWLAEIGYDRAVVKEEEYTMKEFGNVTCQNEMTFYDELNKQWAVRFELKCELNAIIELLERANEAYSIYSIEGCSNAFDYITFCKSISPCIDFTKSSDGTLNVSLLLNVIDKIGNCQLNHYLAITPSEASLLYGKADQYLQSINREQGSAYTIDSLIDDSSLVKSIDIYKSIPNGVAQYTDIPDDKNVYLNVKGIVGVPLSAKEEKYLVYYEDINGNKLYYACTSKLDEFSNFQKNGFCIVNNPLKSYSLDDLQRIISRAERGNASLNIEIA